MKKKAPLWAVGDLQGCFGAFEALLERLDWQRGNLRLWLCGDLVNRGDRSLECLRFCYQNRERIQVVLGNHDLHLLALAYCKREPKRKDTLQPILDAPDRETLIDWLAEQPLLHVDREREAALVHAGLLPEWSVKEASERAAEVEAVLRSSRRKRFFAEMYGNEPERWKSGLKGMDRLRVITNVLTRMRFLSASGTLDMSNKGPIDKAPKGYKPWFHYPRKDKTRLYFGHWAALMGDCDAPRIEALDTGCVWGNALTAVNVDTGERVSVPASAA